MLPSIAVRDVWTNYQAANQNSGLLPYRRYGHVLLANAKDSVVLHGGFTGVLMGDTWAFVTGAYSLQSEYMFLCI